MVVMNTLKTDARVQRAAAALIDDFDLTVIGINEGCEQSFKQRILSPSGNSGLTRYLSFNREVKKLLRKEQPDLFYAHDYYTCNLVRWAKKRWRGGKIVYDSHELIIPDGLHKLSKRDRYFYTNERHAVKDADLVICASAERGAMMAQHYALSNKPLSIDNISELPILYDGFTAGLFEECSFVLNTPGPTLVYAGVLTQSRRLDRLIGIVANRQNTSLLIVGDGPDRQRLEALASSRASGRCHFTGTLPYQYLGAILSRCDIGYVSYPNDTLNNRFCAPNKVYEYASVGLPMIAAENPTLRNLLIGNKIGSVGDDLEICFDEVTLHLNQYKEACGQFIANNRWIEKERLLKSSVNALFY